jgi:transcriptional/translational regulatory protein YebC/TACO1
MNLDTILDDKIAHIVINKVIADLKYNHRHGDMSKIRASIDDLSSLRNDLEDAIDENTIRRLKDIPKEMTAIGAHETEKNEYKMYFVNFKDLSLMTLLLTEYEKHMYFAEVLLTHEKK